MGDNALVADSTRPSPDAHPPRLSPSAASLWAQCPRRWWYRYVERLPEPPPGEPAVLGTFVHRVLELLLDEPADARTRDRARGIARAVWPEIERSEDWMSLGLDDTAGRRFRHRAWATLEGYFRCESPESVRPLERELQLEAEVGGVPFRGVVDLVEEVTGPDGEPTVVVTDYKTGRPPRPGRVWSADDETERLLQPKWYAAALAATGRHRPARARLLYFTATDAPDQGEGVGGGFRIDTHEIAVDCTDEALDDAAAVLRARWEAMAAARTAGGTDASPGPLCGWCPFVAHCEAGRDECIRRWGQRNDFTGGRRLRDDAPAVALLGLEPLDANVAV